MIFKRFSAAKKENKPAFSLGRTLRLVRRLKTCWNASADTLTVTLGWAAEQSWGLQLCQPWPGHPPSSLACSLLRGNAPQSAIYPYGSIWTKKSGTCVHLGLLRNNCREWGTVQAALPCPPVQGCKSINISYCRKEKWVEWDQNSKSEQTRTISNADRGINELLPSLLLSDPPGSSA